MLNSNRLRSQNYFDLVQVVLRTFINTKERIKTVYLSSESCVLRFGPTIVFYPDTMPK